MAQAQGANSPVKSNLIPYYPIELSRLIYKDTLHGFSKSKVQEYTNPNHVVPPSQLSEGISL